MTEIKNWYAVCTRTRCEKKVAGILSRRKIENFFPVNKIYHTTNGDRKKITCEPLFKCCVFVKVSEQEHATLKETDSVVNMIYWMGRPVVISEAEMKLLMYFSGEFNNIKVEKRPVQSDARPLLIDKQMDDNEFDSGISIKISSVTLPSFGYMLQAKTEAGNVKLVSADNSHIYTRSGSITV